jgi:cytochrome c553
MVSTATARARRCPLWRRSAWTYLETVLGKYQSGARKSPEMAAMASILIADDIKGIAAHYAFEKPRGAVFVTVPSK